MLKLVCEKLNKVHCLGRSFVELPSVDASAIYRLLALGVYWHLYSVYRTWPLVSFSNWITGRPLSLYYRLQRLHWLPVKARIEFKIAILKHAIHRQRGPSYLSNMVQYSTPQNPGVASSVPPLLTQLLLCGRGPSSGSAPSQSAVQVAKVFGTRFPHTSETFILLRLFEKLLRLICFCNYRHCNALSVFIDVDRGGGTITFMIMIMT